MMFNPTMGPLNELMSLIGLPNLPFLTHAHWALAASWRSRSGSGRRSSFS